MIEYLLPKIIIMKIKLMIKLKRILMISKKNRIFVNKIQMLDGYYYTKWYGNKLF